MFLLLLALVYGNAYQFQSGFEFCLENEFKFDECKFHLDNVLANPKSIHYDSVQRE